MGDYSSVVVAVLVFILTISYVCVSVDCVHCFNCVSTESLGCGQHLDLTLLVRSSTSSSTSLSSSSSSRGRREAGLNPIGARYSFHHYSSRRKRDYYYPYSSFKSRHSRDLAKLTGTGISDSGKKNISSKYSNDGMFTNLTTISNSDSDNTEITNLNGSLSTTETSSTQKPEIEFPLLHAINKSGRGDSPASSLMIDCPGNTCLIQRIQTTKGNVFVRTCDVSHHVPVGQCHLVTDVLGASVSVVCVCRGHFCNENGNGKSGTTLAGSRTSLVFVYGLCTVLGLFFSRLS